MILLHVLIRASSHCSTSFLAALSCSPEFLYYQGLQLAALALSSSADSQRLLQCHLRLRRNSASVSYLSTTSRCDSDTDQYQVGLLFGFGIVSGILSLQLHVDPIEIELSDSDKTTPEITVTSRKALLISLKRRYEGSCVCEQCMKHGFVLLTMLIEFSSPCGKLNIVQALLRSCSKSQIDLTSSRIWRYHQLLSIPNR